MPCSKSYKGTLLNFDQFGIHLTVHHPTFMSLDKLSLNKLWTVFKWFEHQRLCHN
jgi:hypothetical protein